MQFLAEMDYCGPRGVPWHEFTAWPKVSRDAALLWHQHQVQTCGGCGTHPNDWDPATGGHPRAWVATVHHCPGCAALAARQERAGKAGLDQGQSIALRRQVLREV